MGKVDGWWFGNMHNHCWMDDQEGDRNGRFQSGWRVDRDSHSCDNGGKIIVGLMDS